MINVEVSSLSKWLHQLFTILDFAKELFGKGDIDWVVSRRVHEPPKPEGDVVRSLAQICEDRSSAFNAATTC